MRSTRLAAILGFGAMALLAASAGATEIFVNVAAQAGNPSATKGEVYTPTTPDGGFSINMADFATGSPTAPPLAGTFLTVGGGTGGYASGLVDFGSTTATYGTGLGIRFIQMTGSVNDAYNIGMAATFSALNGGFKVMTWNPATGAAAGWDTTGGPRGNGIFTTLTTDFTHWAAGTTPGTAWNQSGFTQGPVMQTGQDAYKQQFAPGISVGGGGIGTTTNPTKGINAALSSASRIWRNWDVGGYAFNGSSDNAYFLAEIQLVDAPYYVNGTPLSAPPINVQGFTQRRRPHHERPGPGHPGQRRHGPQPDTRRYELRCGRRDRHGRRQRPLLEGGADAAAGATFNAPVGYMTGNPSTVNSSPDNLATYLAGYIQVPNTSNGTGIYLNGDHYMTFAVTTEAGMTIQIGGVGVGYQVGNMSKDGGMTPATSLTEVEFPHQSGANSYWPIYITYSHGAGNYATPGGFEISVADGMQGAFGSNFHLLGDTANGSPAVYVAGTGAQNPTQAFSPSGSAIPSASQMGGNDAGSRLSALGSTPVGTGLQVQVSPRGLSSTMTSITNTKNYFDSSTGASDSFGKTSKLTYTDDVNGVTSAFSATNTQYWPGNQVGANDQYFGARVSGLIYIPAAGTYAFGVTGDEGFQLRVGSQVLGSASGTAISAAGNGYPVNTMMANFSQPGLYPLALYYYNATGTNGLEVSMKGPNSDGLVTLVQGSRNPATNGFSVNLGQNAYAVTPVAHLQKSVDGRFIQGSAGAYVPDLNTRIAPETWTLYERLQNTGRTQASVAGLTATYFQGGPGTSATDDFSTAPFQQYYKGTARVTSGYTATGATSPNFVFTGSINASGQAIGGTGGYCPALFGSPSIIPYNEAQAGNTGTNFNDVSNVFYRMAGYINIPATGNYHFEMHSDDVSWMFLNTNSDPSKTMTANYSTPPTVIGDPRVNQDTGNGHWHLFWDNLYLTAGLHAIAVQAREFGGGENSELEWSGPGFGLQDIPFSAFSTDTYDGLLVPLATGTGQVGDALGNDGSFPGVGIFDYNSTHDLVLTTMTADQTASFEGTFIFNPEPTTMVLLGVGLLALARRRRQQKVSA